MNIAVLVKQVPDTWAKRTLNPADWTLDRDSVESVIDEIDTRGVETALLLAEEHGGEVTVLTMGDDKAVDALRKALAMGAHKAVHINDETLAGSCALQTSAALAAAIGTLSVDLVITGNESTDGTTGTIAAMLAERLGWSLVSAARKLTVDGAQVRAERVRDNGYSDVTAALPAVVSVMEKVAEPRYPSFKGIMAAKKKSIAAVTAADLGLSSTDAGLAQASTRVTDAAVRPPRSTGEKVDAAAAADVFATLLTTANV